MDYWVLMAKVGIYYVEVDKVCFGCVGPGKGYQMQVCIKPNYGKGACSIQGHRNCSPDMEHMETGF